LANRRRRGKHPLDGPVSKLISWNIAGRVNKATRSKQLDWIKRERADILAFQEVARVSELRQELSKLGFTHFECTKPTANRKKLVAIASRKPLRRIRLFSVPHPERAISCLISLGRKEAELHCVHVPYGQKYAREKIRFLEVVTRGVSTRKLPQLLVGDFNCPQVMSCEEAKIVTWAKYRKDSRWQLMKSYKGVAGKKWNDAELNILRPKGMKDTYTFLKGRTRNTYFTKAKSSPNCCFDHIIASGSIVPRDIRLKVTRKLSDHAALVAEW
jgi:exonuclease III